MEQGQPKWWTRERWVSLGVFAGFSLLNLWLMCVGGCIGAFTLGPPPPGQVKVADVWLWCVAFPAMATKDLDFTLANVLMVANPFLYGGMGWFAWRMWSLMRAKPKV